MISKQVTLLISFEVFLISLVGIYFVIQPSDAERSTLLTAAQYSESLARDIRIAEQYVYATTYFVEAYPENAILAELESARERGVEVRLMLDHHTLDEYPTILKDLEERNIPYKVISNHAKVVVVDNEIAYVGSSNWNRNGLELNWELNLRTNTATTVVEAYHFLDTIWEEGRKPVFHNDVSPERFVNGDEFYNILIENLENAESIKILTYMTTYDYENPDALNSRVFNKVRDTYDRGATLQFVMDNSEYHSWSSAQRFLVENDMPHKLDEQETENQILHAKVFLIDDEVLFIGSHNMDHHSLLSSQQASIMTTDPHIVTDFLIIFDEKWESSIYPPSDGGRQQ